ncbi:hypothetical protein DL767_010700 [Monosporascus sp. MG133]|nr:hypothetical protein DL767_010700 [Monosporascus sp. MG133]
MSILSSAETFKQPTLGLDAGANLMRPYHTIGEVAMSDAAYPDTPHARYSDPYTVTQGPTEIKQHKTSVLTSRAIKSHGYRE